MGVFFKIIISFLAAGIATSSAFLATSVALSSLIDKIKWLKVIVGCLRMMFAPVLALPFADLVTIESGVAKATPPSFFTLIFMNTLIYLVVGGLIAAGYVWARWLMYMAFGLIGLYWTVCIGTSIIF
jgi:hypothetical protein